MKLRPCDHLNGFLSLALCLFWLQLPTVGEACNNFPEKLAFYYGWPSLVNQSNADTNRATDVFSAYDAVVFGDGIEHVSHGDHVRIQTIIQNLKQYGTNVYGYIDLSVTVSNLSFQQIATYADEWVSMGAAGIFLDQAGYDFSVSRQRLNSVVDYVHHKGLSAFINAWNPDDVFSPGVDKIYNPTDAATHLGENDFYLLESFAVENSTYQDPAFLISRANKALHWNDEYGTMIATVNTVAANNPPFNQNQFAYVWWTTLLYNFDAMAWGETANYSATSLTLPYHERPNPGDIGDPIWPIKVTNRGSQNARRTTKGTIRVDTSAHIGSFSQK
jgi:hypothetical protein